MMIETVIKWLSDNTDFRISGYFELGRGASGVVYKVVLENEPYVAAVKISKFPNLLKKEYLQIKYINDRIDCKLPEIYDFYEMNDNLSFMLMEYFDGISADKIKFRRVKRKNKKLAEQITDNLLKLHSVHNCKFGPVDHAVYDSWYDYYSEFAKEIYDFAKQAYNDGKIKKKVFCAVEASYLKLDKILCGSTGEPTLIHGDYWLPNFIVNDDTYDFMGCIDPFNIMWAEPEYELFTLTVGRLSEKLNLYKIYKCKISPTELCDLKSEMYALYNELLWHKNLGLFNNNYLMFRSKRLLKQMKVNGLL